MFIPKNASAHEYIGKWANLICIGKQIDITYGCNHYEHPNLNESDNDIKVFKTFIRVLFKHVEHDEL